MHTTTLLTNSALQLDDSTVETVRASFRGSELRWLAYGSAAEFDHNRVPKNRWNIWESLQAQGIDMIVQPTANRRKALLVADMDSTMIQQECIDELAEMAGVGDEVRKITARAMNGGLDFESALLRRVHFLKGQSISIVEKVLAERISYMPGGATLLATMHAAGAPGILVSGGFTSFAAPVAERLGFAEYRANELLEQGGLLTGDVARPILGRDAKVRALQEACEVRGIDSSDVIAVGDGANDIGMLDMAGTGVALHAKPSVAEQCEIRINHGDLTALLYLQGYTREEFVT